MIIDAHVHISLHQQHILHHGLLLDEYTKQMKDYDVTDAIVFLNPFDSNYCCPNTKPGNLHKSIVKDLSESQYTIDCLTCDRPIYRGEDIFQAKNVELLKDAEKEGLFALAFLTAPRQSIQNQVSYYEQEYPSFLGYKIHPTIMMYPADILRISSHKTIVFHSGNDSYSSPKQLLKFAKHYSGNVVIAHFARFDRNTLKELARIDNIWVDTSPFTFLHSLMQNKPNQLVDALSFSGLSCNDTFFELMDIVGIDKIIFASDSPFGNLSEEILFVKQLNLSQSESQKILCENAKNAFLLG